MVAAVRAAVVLIFAEVKVIFKYIRIRLFQKVDIYFKVINVCYLDSLIFVQQTFIK